MRFFDINVIEQIEYLRVPQSFYSPFGSLKNMARELPSDEMSGSYSRVFLFVVLNNLK